MQARVVFRDANNVERAVDLPTGTGTTSEPIVIGRGDGCSVQIPDASLSRRHAYLTIQDGRWIVVDSNSTGGTFVNERRVQAAALAHGDWIRCGGIYFQFQTQLAAPAYAAVAAQATVAVAPPPAAPVAPVAQAAPRAGSRNPALFRSREKGYVFTDGYVPTVENLDRALIFLPIFEDTSRPFYTVESVGGEFKYRFSTEVQRFVQVAVEQGLVVEGLAVEWLLYKHPIYRNPLAIDGADLATCQRLLTAFVDDGAETPINLAQALHGGLLVRVLYRLRVLREELAAGRGGVESGRIEVVMADLTNLGADAVIIPTDERLSGGGGLDAMIRTRAGGELASWCQRIGTLPTGEARLVPGFSAPASYLIFTVGPRWGGGDYGEDTLLVRCYESSLRLCIDKGAHTVGCAAIATGAMGFPPARAAQIAIAAARRALASSDQLWKISFACHDQEVYRHFVAAIDTPPDFQPNPQNAAKATASAGSDGPAASGATGTAAAAAPREPIPVPKANLPNPEGRQVSVFLTQNFLQNGLFAEMTLEAYRLSRTLLNDARSHLSQLDGVLRALRTARAQGPAEELALLSRWSFDDLGATPELEALIDRAHIVVRGATGTQQASCLYGLRLFLRALRDAYLVQARFFSMTHKIEQNGTPNLSKPTLRELADAWAAVHLGAIIQHRAQRVFEQEPTSFESSTSVQLLRPEDPQPFGQVTRALSIGASALCGTGEDFFLIVGYVGSLDRYYCLRPLTGAAELAARQRLSRSQSPLDYLCIVDPALDAQTAKLALKAVSPESA